MQCFIFPPSIPPRTQRLTRLRIDQTTFHSLLSASMKTIAILAKPMRLKNPAQDMSVGKPLSMSTCCSCSSAAHQRTGPGVGWGWTSPCSAVSTSWHRSWFRWRWALWRRWWVGPRAWCTFPVWCHLWGACTPHCVWCTICHLPRVSLPRVRRSHCWCTFRPDLSHNGSNINTPEQKQQAGHFLKHELNHNAKL